MQSSGECLLPCTGTNKIPCSDWIGKKLLPVLLKHWDSPTLSAKNSSSLCLQLIATASNCHRVNQQQVADFIVKQLESLRYRYRYTHCNILCSASGKMPSAHTVKLLETVLCMEDSVGVCLHHLYNNPEFSGTAAHTARSAATTLLFEGGTHDTYTTCTGAEAAYNSSSYVWSTGTPFTHVTYMKGNGT
jgi:hypothetical protein